MSKEGESFEVSLAVAKMSQLVNETLDDDDDDDGDIKDVPLPNVGSEVLRKVISFGEHYQEEQMTPIQPPFKSEKLDDLVR